MKTDELRDYLSRKAVEFTEEKIPYGTLFRCPDGEIFTVYDKGKFTAQGTQTTLTGEIKSWQKAGCPTTGVAVARVVASAPAKADQPVFIVYGHDSTSRDAIELLMRRMGLEPIILQNLPAAGDTIIEKLEHYLGEHGKVGFACVLLTPDDEGHKAGLPEERKYRARQNVVLELGMVLASLV